MGDAENAVPPSLKRAAERELSRENPDLDDEDDVCDQEAGTFKKASEEVLANRRIVKVRRNRTSSVPSTPSSNPFASIQLVPPTNSTSIPVTVTSFQVSQENVKKEEACANQESENEVTNVQESQDNVKKEEDGGNQEPESKVDEVAKPEAASEARKPESANAESAKEEAESEETTLVTVTSFQESLDNVKKEEACGNQEPGNEVANVQESQDNVKKEEDGGNREPESKVDEVAKPEAVSEATKPESANAESTKEEAESEKKNIEKGTTFTSFQQLSSTQNAFTGIVGTGFSSSTFSFGPITKTDQPSFPSFSFGTNGNSSLFGPVCEKPETPSSNKVETGEENEKAVFTAVSVLYEFLDGGWKERGKGEVKVNISTTGNEKGRLVMRAKGNYRLILNASLFPDMKLTTMEKKWITFACLNSIDEGKDGLSTFALKFRDAAIVEQFHAVVTQHKGNHANIGARVSSLKTPENSPKASDG